MKRESIEGLITGQFAEATPEQIKAIVDAVMAANGRDINSAKAELEATTGELTALKAKADELEKFRLSTLSEEERRKEEAERTAKLASEYRVKLNRIEAEKAFVKAGFTEEDYGAVLDSIVTEDEAATKTSTDLIVGLLAKNKEQVTASVKSSLLDATPKPIGKGASERTFTKEQFDSMSYSQRVKLYNESPEQYAQLAKE